MASRFDQWKKENQLFMELDENPIEPNQSLGNTDDFRNKIDNMLKMAFDKLKKDLANTFGRDIKDQIKDTQKVAIEYLKKAYMNLQGQKLESYYQESAFNKLNRMFNEVETVTQPTGDVVSNVKRVSGLTNYLDNMRSAIMKHVDQMLVAARNDHLYKSIQDVRGHLDTHGDKIHSKIQDVKSHATKAINSALEKRFPTPTDFSKDKDLSRMVKKGV
jgi:hypothetical protein